MKAVDNVAELGRNDRATSSQDTHPSGSQRGNLRDFEVPAGVTLPERGTRGRVLMVTSNYPRWSGDATTPFVHHLAQDLQELGWRIDVLAPHASEASRREVLGGVAVERFRYLWPASLQTLCYGGGAMVNLRNNPWNALMVPPFVAAEWCAVARRLASGRYDLVHSHWILPQGFTVGIAARLWAVPHVLTVHGSDAFALRGELLTRCKRMALSAADVVTVNSGATLKAVTTVSARQMAIEKIPMGAASSTRPEPSAVARLRRRFRRGEGPLLAYVGRLVEEKGVGDLIQAVGLLVRRAPATIAIIVGDGQDRSRFETLADRLGVKEHIAFVGWVAADEIANYLAAADMFVGPSRHIEGQGLTIAEAMLAGTPVIATPVGGITDLVRHDETGVLVSPESPAAIAAAAERIMAEPGLADRLRQAAMAAASSGFTRAASARSFSDLFLRTIAARRRCDD